MANCYRCGAETQLYSMELPICITCADILAARSNAIQNDVQLSLPHE
jgi:hypothetical protein